MASASRLRTFGTLGTLAELAAIAAIAAIAAGFVGDPLVAAGAPGARFSRLSVDDGLSASSVESILQDRYGFLWFGTQEGLDRFDGQRFVSFAARPEQGFLHDGQITALASDRRGDLWVGTPAGLQRLDLATGRFDESTAPASRGVGSDSLAVAEDGRVWFGGADGGLWVLDPEAALAPPVAVSIDGLDARTPVEALAPAGGSAVWVLAAGNLWSVARDGERFAATLAAEDLGGVSILASDPGRRGVWIGRHAGPLLFYDSAARKMTEFPEIAVDVLAIRPARDGTIWIGARDAGLTRFNPATGEIVTHRNDPSDAASLSEDDVASLYEDRSGSLWIGTWNGGVGRYDPGGQAFVSLVRRPWDPRSLPDNDVVSMVEAPDGRLWILSRNDVLAAGSAQGGFDVVTLPARERDLAGIAWADGRIYVASGRGLRAIDPRSLAETALPKSALGAALDRTDVDAVAGDGATLWAVAGKTLFRLPGAVAPAGAIRRAELPFASAVTCLAIGRGGRLWLGSDTGEVAVAEPATGGTAIAVRLISARGPRGALGSRGFVTALWEASDDILWVGTRRGLGRVDVDAGTLLWIDDAARLPSLAIAGVLGDRDGNIWVATNRGITRLDDHGRAAVQFGTAEGAQSTGYASGAAAAGASGTFYFAGHGVTAFDPAGVAVDTSPPAVVFTGLEILHRDALPRWLDPSSPLTSAVHSTDSITLPAAATVFSVEMATLRFADPASVVVVHRLEGFDSDWVESESGRRIATYTRLAPGDYVLRARARVRNGEWSEREARLAIRILPPWWRTPRALSGWSAVVLLAIGGTLAGARRRGRIRVALAEREVLRSASITDPLTGLFNRRFLAVHLEHEVPKLLRDYRVGGTPAGERGPDLLFVLIDIDHFKEINDIYGHADGDRAIVKLAARLREQIRDEDLAIRWGGDELLVVARSFDRLHAPAAVERLRHALGGLDLELGEAARACTVSIGWAPFPFLPAEPGALSWEQTLRLADRALLASKRRGRDRWTGFLAANETTPKPVIEFLTDAAAELPDSIVVVKPDD